MNAKHFIITCLLLFSTFLQSCENEGLHGTTYPLVYQLNWTPDPTFADAYIAADKNKGFFQKEGLSVEIRPGGYGIDAIAAVVAKRADFAVVGADKAAIAFSNGAPIRVVAIEFQRNPVGWMVRSDKNIKKISDLSGRTDIALGDKVGTETTAILELMLQRLNLSDKVKVHAVGFETAYFFQNENSVYPVYLNEEPVTARMNNINITEIDPQLPENGGISLYGNVIIAHKDFIDKKPKIAKAFTYAMRQAWLFAKEFPHEAEAILRQHNGFDTPQMPEVLRRSVSFATRFNDIDVPPGHMEISQWDKTLSVLIEAKLLTKKIKISDLVWIEGVNN